VGPEALPLFLSVLSCLAGVHLRMRRCRLEKRAMKSFELGVSLLFSLPCSSLFLALILVSRSWSFCHGHVVVAPCGLGD